MLKKDVSTGPRQLARRHNVGRWDRLHTMGKARNSLGNVVLTMLDRPSTLGRPASSGNVTRQRDRDQVDSKPTSPLNPPEVSETAFHREEVYRV